MRMTPLAALKRAIAAPRPRTPTLIERLTDPLDEVVRLLLDEGSTGVLIVDRHGRILRANGALRRMVSPRVDLRAGAPATGLFREAEREPVAAALRDALAGVPALGKLLSRLVSADPDPDHSVDVAITALREPDRSLSGLLLRFTDQTAQSRLEAELAHSQKLQAVGQLAGGIAHDFNNLLTAVLAAAELVLDREATPAATIEDVRQIRASALRGAALVRQLLAFGRRQAMQARIIPINDAIQDLAGMLERLLGGRITLALDLETPGRLVRIDPTQLDQVLVNLAVNARDAMPEGGRLTLRSAHTTLYRPWTQGQETIPPGRYVMVEVADTGRGIPPEALPRIFDPFFTTRRERGGTGLGLSTVHGIVRQSDGYLSVQSEVGKGTSMRFYLPRYDEDAAVVIASAAPTASVLAPDAPDPIRPAIPPGPRTVLLVDDEDAVRRLTARALAQRGWTVLAADSGEAALALLQGRAADPAEPAPAILISDMVMPGMDGTTLVATVRQRYPGLPAILVSGYAEEMLRKDVRGDDVVFVSKPYSLRSLLAEVDQLSAAAPASVGAASSGGL